MGAILLARLELEHLRCTAIAGMRRILPEVADLALALHAAQGLPEEAALLLPQALDAAQLLSALPVRPVTVRVPVALDVRDISVVIRARAHGHGRHASRDASRKAAEERAEDVILELRVDDG